MNAEESPGRRSLAAPARHHIPALDGLRGIAVLLILWVHVPTKMLGSFDFYARGFVQPGYLGVDIFFVLSGFLITRILLVDRDRGYPLRNFLMRRLLRIFPIYYLTLAVVAIVAYGPEVPWCAAYLSNFYFPFHEGRSHLPHTWSLAVEEHFYLVWPLLLYSLSLRKSLGLVLCCIPLAIVCAVLAIRAPEMPWSQDVIRDLLDRGLIDRYDADSFIYQNTLFRASSLAIGCLFAFGESWIQRRPIIFMVLAFLGLALAEFILAWVMSGHVLFALKWAPLARLVLFNVISGSIVLGTIAMGVVRWPVIHLIQNPVLAAVGRISYGLYLYHLPLYHVAGLYDVEDRTGWTILSAVALTFVVSTLSFLFIEKPILRFGNRFRSGAH